ncbi:protein translocase component YidC [Candidatus Parcubacteria bacterium]|nr:MAG: protein translocase component YidC [Candidatus Parcubacteria bacterium]
MISAAFNTLVYEPLYNGLVFFVSLIPSHDVGLAVIALTIVVRFILFPLSRRAIETQIQMKKIAPEVEALKEKFKDKREEQGRAILALYRERGVRPFASFALLLVQLPILIGLYWVFSHGGLPEVNMALLYSFVPVPESIEMVFLGIIAMDGHSILLAALAGVTQFVYTRLSTGKRTPVAQPAGASFSADMARSFDLQVRYILPVMVAVISYYVVAAAPLYWATSNLFMIGQEYLMGRRF